MLSGLYFLFRVLSTILAKSQCTHKTTEDLFRPMVIFDDIRLHRFRFYHVMFCLQSQQYIVQQETFENGHTKV